MKRRALLARSMIYEPELLLMDEPFAALDAQLRTQMHVELRRTVRELDQTVLFVTHDVDEAALLSDRVLVIGGGPPAATVAEIEMPFGPDRDVEGLRYEDGFAEVVAGCTPRCSKRGSRRRR
jgi:NitT/TauT family transport system ATP-binding protein